MLKRIIKITNHKIFYTMDDFVTLSQTNFPINDITFKSEGSYCNFYWEVEIISYNNLTKDLRIKITNYTSNDIAKFNGQKAKETVNKLIFEDLEWEKFEPFLSSYKISSLWPLISEKSKSEYNDKMVNINNSNSVNCNVMIESKVNDFSTYQIRTYNEEFRFPIKDAVFSKGYVSIQCKFDFYNSKIELKVYNSNILPEYNHIKNFVHKILKRKTFTINAEIIIGRDGKINTKANSPEIEVINDDFIQIINQKQIQRAIKKDFKPELNKCLFTADEFLSKEHTGKSFIKDELGILKSVLNMTDVRNKRQLEYLSGYIFTQ